MIVISYANHEAAISRSDARLHSRTIARALLGERRNNDNAMKLAGFLLMPAGWLLVVCALVMLGAPAARGAFVFAGVGVEILGFVLLARVHLAARRESE